MFQGKETVVAPSRQNGEAHAVAPHSLLLSMFVVVLALMNDGITESIAEQFDNRYSLLSFGTLSAGASNLMNNLPMSMFFVGILSSVSEPNLTPAVLQP